MLKVFEQKQGMVVCRDQPGGLEKTGVGSVWMKTDSRWGGKHSGEEN